MIMGYNSGYTGAEVEEMLDTLIVAESVSDTTEYEDVFQ